MASPEAPRVASPMTSPQANRLRLHDNSAVAARKSIINSSAKGWSPLQINKRSGSGTGTPLRPQDTGDSVASSTAGGGGGGSKRRTSSSFRHMTTNSLVANSPFKNLTTREGQLSNGVDISPNRVIHERRTPNRALGQTPRLAQGSGSTPRNAIGLGVSGSPTKGDAVRGTRRVSKERKLSNSRRTSGERKTSGSKQNERKVSGGQENESPPPAAGAGSKKKKKLPRQSMAYKALVENEYVSHSPFLEGRSNSASSRHDAESEGEQEVMASPPRRRVSSGSLRRVSPGPSSNLAQNRTSMSPSSSPRQLSNPTVAPSPLREEMARASLRTTPNGRTPTKSSLASSKRLLGPRRYGHESPTRKTVTFQHVPEVKEFDIPSAETSLNESYVEDDGDDWEDEAEHGDDWMRQVVNHEGNSFDEEEMNQAGDESATADFMDEIFGDDVLDGDTPVFADHDRFEIPLEQSFDQSLTLNKSVEEDGGPLFEFHDMSVDDVVPPSPKHVHTYTPHLNPGKQPNLPHNEDHSLLLNADARQPATRAPHQTSPPGPHAHQDGPLFDPFITTETATEVLVGTQERFEDGVPLGRTSHHDRIQARRLLATQSLGLGFPGTVPKAGAPSRGVRDSDSDESPPAEVHKTLPDLPQRSSAPVERDEDVFGAVIASPAARKVSSPRTRKVSNRVVSDVPELQGPSRRMAAFKANKTTPKKSLEPLPQVESTPKRSLPRPPPPAPAAIDVPSPVQYVPQDREDASESEAESTASTITKESRTTATREEVASAASAYLDMAYGQQEVSDPPVPDSRPRISDIAPQLSLPQELVEDAEHVSESESESELEPPSRRISDYAPQLELSRDFEDTQLDIDPDSDGEYTPEGEDDEPLTPPRMQRTEREESPRIPSFDLGEFSVDLPQDDSDKDESHESAATVMDTPRPTTFVTSPSPSPAPATDTTCATPGRATPSPTPGHSSVPGTPTGRSTPPTPLATSPADRFAPTTPSRAMTARPTATSPLASPPVNAPRSIASEFGPLPNQDGADASQNTLVRQRISREAIRQSVNKRMAAEGLTSPRPVSAAADFGGGVSPDSPTSRVSFAPPSPAYARHTRGSSSSSLDKELPPSRPGSAAASHLSAPSTPTAARSPSALSRLREGESDRNLSALDRIASSFGADSEPNSPASVSTARDKTATGERYVDSPSKVAVARPVSILNKPPAPPNPSGSGSIVNTAITTAKARKSRRRSASLGEIEAAPVSNDLLQSKTKKTPRVSLGLKPGGEFMMDSVHAELDQIGSGRGYRIRENRRYVRATYTDGLKSQPGDLEDGSRRVWRPASQLDPDLRAFKERTASLASAESVPEEEPKTLVFVKVLGIEALNMPIPDQTTYFTIRVSNGVDTILTPYAVLADGASIHREYCLTELANSEFSLQMEVRRDAHIVAMERALKAPEPVQRLAPPPAPVPVRAESPVASFSSRASNSSRTSGFRALFSSPRKKHTRSQSSMAAIPTQRPAPPPPVAKPPPKPVKKDETLANYLGGEGNKVLGKTHIAIEPIARQCEAKVLEIRYPMFSMYKNQPSPDGPTRKQVAKVTVQILRLPALPGLAISELPGSIDETLKGLRNHLWHQHIYHEGTLTQLGGDCRLPRRRLMRLVGGHLHAINEVTRKEVASIDLSKATEVVDLNAKGTTSDDYDPYGARPRSFAVRFNDGESISFSADRDEDKLVWMDALKDLVGRVPPNPLWARVYAQIEREQAATRSVSGTSVASGRHKSAPRRSARASGIQQAQ